MTNSYLEPTDDFFAQFLDDYFAECDEHLTAARQGLLLMEAQVDGPGLDRPLLEDLFRRFHSVKGLSGMIGLREAEQLAHHLESILRLLRNGAATLTRATLDALVDGTRALEQVIAARHAAAAPPDTSAVLAQLAAILPPAPPKPAQERTPPTPEQPAARPEQAAAPAAATPPLVSQAPTAAAEAPTWRCEFIPSPALAERGINVNTVRARLQGIGELLHAAPLVREQGGIAFEFLVRTNAHASLLTGWGADGLSCTPQEAPIPAPDETAAVLSAPHPPDGSGVTEPAPTVALTPSNLVRVDLSRLDELMRMTGELVISRARLEDKLARLEASVDAGEWRALQEVNQALGHQLRDLREGIMRVRMVPIGELFTRMQFAIYDLARATGKQVRLELSGQDTEIDKYVIERMMDPLLHLVRNAVSHGLELPDERMAQGKPVVGQVLLRAGAAGDSVMIQVEDDGRGVDAEKVAARGRALGLVTGDAPLNTAALLDLLCTPGFSTRDEADLASGRGVGMAVVKTTVQELGGVLLLDMTPGRGTRFTIQLPLTLAIADALIVVVGGQRFAVPLLAVREVTEIALDAVKTLDGDAQNQVLLHRGNALALLQLARYFHLPTPEGQSAYALVIGNGLNSVGLVVDRVLEQREVVVRPLADPFVQSPGLAGATELGDGRVVLILDVGALTKAQHRM